MGLNPRPCSLHRGGPGGQPLWCPQRNTLIMKVDISALAANNFTIKKIERNYMVTVNHIVIFLAG